MELVVGVVHPVHPENGLEATFIEPGVMGDERESLDKRLYLVPDIGEQRGVFGIIWTDSVDSHAEPLVVFGFRMDEAVVRINDFSSTDNDDPDTAYAAGLLICRLEIYCREISHVRLRKKLSFGQIYSLFGDIVYIYRKEKSHMKMRRILPSLTAIAAAAAVVSCGGGEEAAIRQAISYQLSVFPVSRAYDVYKNFCQDNLGPGHLIPNPDAASSYLQRELSEYREDLAKGLYTAPELKFYPVGDCGNFYRVDLSVILDSLIDQESFFSAFLKSTNEGPMITNEEWKEKWSKVEAVLRKSFPDMPGLEEDLAELDSYVAKDDLIMHHSDLFEQTYHPHYRIIGKEVFEKEILPFISGE